MSIFLRRLALVLRFALVAQPVHAQTVVHSTFGPGDAYNPFVAWSLGATLTGRQSVAASFTYASGTTAPLDFFRVALNSFDPPGPLTARFLAGTDMNTATELETFSRTVSTPGFSSSIFTFESLLNPLLAPGETYWVALSVDAPASDPGGWNQNNRGHTGAAFRLTDDGAWFVNSVATTPAFDVAVGTVTPEPMSLALLGTGLAGVAAARRRRKKEQQSA